MRAVSICLAGAALLVAFASMQAEEDAGEAPGWKPGRGWGWIWGPQDEVGALNAMTDATRLRALRSVRDGRVYDLGVPFSRESLRWPGHSPTEIMTFRSPESLKRQLDQDFLRTEKNPTEAAWHSTALFINDNVGTQIDGLGHITVGADDHWYNGFREQDWGGDFGIRKCDATTIPPIIARGVMLDIAGLQGVEALPPHYAITPADIDAASKRQEVELRPGDVVLIRTGTLRFWGRTGSDHARLEHHGSAGITLETARHLVERYGAMMIGSDTVGLEVSEASENTEGQFPVHVYLLVEQGVHVAELHDLEALARDGVAEFTYVAVTNPIRGTTAGFTLRPLALR